MSMPVMGPMSGNADMPNGLPGSLSNGTSDSPLTHSTSGAVSRYRLQLFVTGSTPRSSRAIENMISMCEEHLQGRYEYEIVDVYQTPEATRELQIIATPTLVKVSPGPLRRVIGDLSDRRRVLTDLSVLPPPPSSVNA